MWNEAVVAYFKVLPHHVGDTEEKCEAPVSGQPISEPRFELRSANYTTANIRVDFKIRN